MTRHICCHFKVGHAPFRKVSFICLNEISLKMMNNDFYFILKPLFVLKIFKFLSLIRKKRLDKKNRFNFKIFDVSLGKKTITIHTLPNISRKESNQTIKFGQSIQYNMRNIFLQKSCRKWGRGTSSRPLLFFLKKFCKK